MFNLNKPVYQIGIEDGGGGWHRPHRYHPDQLAKIRRELENPSPPKYLQLTLKEGAKFWTIGNGAELSIDLTSGDFQPAVADGERFTIKVPDVIIECERNKSMFHIVSIKNQDGAVFNTLQVPHTSKLASMLRVTTISKATSIYH